VDPIEAGRVPVTPNRYTPGLGSGSTALVQTPRRTVLVDEVEERDGIERLRREDARAAPDSRRQQLERLQDLDELLSRVRT
jgi:hypothetical protein